MSDPHVTWADNHTLPLRPGVLTEQVNLLRQLERARVTFLKEYHELPSPSGGIRRLRNIKGGGYTHHLWDDKAKTWVQISVEEFELELDRNLARMMYEGGRGPYMKAN